MDTLQHACDQSLYRKQLTQFLKIMESAYFVCQGIVFIDYWEKGRTTQGGHYVSFFGPPEYRCTNETFTIVPQETYIPPQRVNSIHQRLWFRN